MKAARLLAITLLLQARGKLTATELADVLEVSERTIYRDIASLEAARVPVVAESGPEGGYSLPDGYRVDPTRFSGEEAASLAIGGAILQGVQGVAMTAALQQALAKIEAALPPEHRPTVRAGRERFLFDTAPWFASSSAPEQHLPALRSAVLDGRRVRLCYGGRDAVQCEWRDVDPLGLVYKAGVWYLVGHCFKRLDLRTFHVGRIEAVEVLAIPRACYQGFDLARYWEESRARVEMHPVFPVRVRVHASSASSLLRRAAQVLRVTQMPGGAIEAELDLESHERAISFVLGAGCEAEVLAPSEVRAGVADAAARMAARHRA
jgi:predicted DNA-binding transcriptional regulator YafY